MFSIINAGGDGQQYTMGYSGQDDDEDDMENEVDSNDAVGGNEEYAVNDDPEMDQHENEEYDGNDPDMDN